jgi:16S rRNA (cytosine1402-N4)-methyltransferase
VKFVHQTVLLEETVRYLHVRPGRIYVDGTLGGGGHAERILSSAPNVLLVGIDKDPHALAAAAQRLSSRQDQVVLIHSDFAAMKDVLAARGIRKVAGIVLDLGVSSPQFDAAERGFSYQHAAVLDMRMNPQSQLTAEMLVNELSEAELARIIREYGEERWAVRIAAFIVKARAKTRITTTTQLVDVIKQAIPAAARRQGPHPARRTFQALRIAVNDELGSLRKGLEAAVELLEAAGRIAVISFHSLEDGIVKRFFQQEQDPCICPKHLPCVCHKQARLKVITPKGIRATPEEVERNPRSRSATLRVAERVLTMKEDA